MTQLRKPTETDPPGAAPDRGEGAKSAIYDWRVQLEKIRSRAIQTALAGSDRAKTPDKLITDDELMALLKKCADERADLIKKNQVQWRD